MSTEATQVPAHSGVSGRFRAYVELTKPRIASLILVVTMAAFFIASKGDVSLLRMFVTFVGTALLSAGIFVLNHYLERDVDGLMRRTAERPLPSGRIAASEALSIGVVAVAASLVVLFLFVNIIAGIVAVFTIVSYLLVYTPMKRHTPYHTAIGALSGATPPLLGWAAASGQLPLGAWVLFGILFYWQFPHFLSIELMYREDYQRAGMKVLPVVDSDGRLVRFEIIATLVLLLAIGLLPFLTGLSGLVYLCAALVLGSGFLAQGIVTSRRYTKIQARKLLRASVIYLPLLFVFMLANVR